jgi:hypothetical protein
VFLPALIHFPSAREHVGHACCAVCDSFRYHRWSTSLGANAPGQPHSVFVRHIPGSGRLTRICCQQTCDRFWLVNGFADNVLIHGAVREPVVRWDQRLREIGLMTGALAARVWAFSTKFTRCFDRIGTLKGLGTLGWIGGKPHLACDCFITCK